jgi:hypothetical protein
MARWAFRLPPNTTLLLAQMLKIVDKAEIRTANELRHVLREGEKDFCEPFERDTTRDTAA